MISLPKTKAKDKTHCTECGAELTKKTQRIYNGVKYGQCRECIIKKVKKHNDKRKKALKESKWF
jgi:late competence protein required for DNA uptake (superfamily II DNA/RNA helicase)